MSPLQTAPGTSGLLFVRSCVRYAHLYKHENPNRFFHVGEGFGFCSVIDDFYSESIALPSSMIRIRTRMP